MFDPCSRPRDDVRVASARLARRLGRLALLGLFASVGLSLAQPVAGGYDFRLVPVLDTLSADGESETTLVAFLTSRDGAAIEGEEIRFVVRDGLGHLGRSNATSVDAEDVGHGVYVARFRAGDVAGSVTVGALWLSAAESPLPEARAVLELVSATSLTVLVDDDDLLAERDDEATLVAYVLDGLGRPLADADVTFRIVAGGGQLRALRGAGVAGRYAAVFRPSNVPGETIVEVALPGVSSGLREQVTLRTLQAATLEAVAFPQTVASVRNRRVETVNAATVLVAVRNSDGELIRGLDDDELVAQVIAGPGEIGAGREIRIGSGRDSGVYAFTFTASDTVGESVIRIAQPSDPGKNATVTLRTVVVTETGQVETVTLMSFADEPFFASEDAEVLLVAAAADRRGNAVVDLRPEFRVTHGQGSLGRSVSELAGRGGSRGSGLYLTTLEAGRAGVNTVTEVRAVFSRDDGDIRSESIDIGLTAFEAPRVVVFPGRIPAGEDGVAVIDVFDFEGRRAAVRSGSERYQVEIEEGPGFLDEEANNRGRTPDLVSGDHISAALYEASGSLADEQEIVFSVVDLAAPGFPVTLATLIVGQAIDIEVLTARSTVDRGEEVMIVAFARDEFGLPAIDHDLVLTVESGSATLLRDGLMTDDGGRVGDVEDPFADDGMYVGAIRVTGTAGSDSIRLRVTDLTPPDQPTGVVSLTPSR